MENNGNGQGNENQQRQQNSVDRVNGLIKKAKSVYKAGKRIKQGAQFLRAVSTAGEAAEGVVGAEGAAGVAAATSEIWVPILLIFLIIILVVVIISVIISTSSTNAGTPTVTPTPPPTTSPNLVYYSQYDPKWEFQGCDLVTYGCAPTSVAMVLSSYGKIMTPIQVALQTNAGCTSATSYNQWPSILTWIDGFGFTHSGNLISGNTFLTNIAEKYLNQGYIIVAGADLYFASSCQPTEGGHEFVITSVNSNTNTATAYDPTLYYNYCSKYNTKSRTINLTPGGCGSSTLSTNSALPPNVCSWLGFNAYAIKKL